MMHAQRQHRITYFRILFVPCTGLLYVVFFLSQDQREQEESVTLAVSGTSKPGKTPARFAACGGTCLIFLIYFALPFLELLDNDLFLHAFMLHPLHFLALLGREDGVDLESDIHLCLFDLQLQIADFLH